MFKVYYTNHFYYSAEEFKTFQAAVQYGKQVGCEFAVHEPRPWPNSGNELVYSWSPIEGTRYYTPRYRGVA
jgi:hypothetical protein